MKVRDVMRSPVITVGVETPLKEVAELLAGNGISGIPVVDTAGSVVGVVSEADILYKERPETETRRGLFGLLLEAASIDAETKLHARTAGEAMTSPPITIHPARALTQAAEVMLEERVNRLPVVDEDGELVGIVTRADLVRAFVRSDEVIESEIREDVILRALWIAPEQINVKVERGEVTLTGQVESEAEAELVPRFVQQVPGVVTVVSKLSWSHNRNRSRSRERVR
jgi:CBS domain-containing protein